MSSGCSHLIALMAGNVGAEMAMASVRINFLLASYSLYILWSVALFTANPIVGTLEALILFIFVIIYFELLELLAQ